LNNLLTNEEKYAAFPDPEASVKTTRAWSIRSGLVWWGNRKVWCEAKWRSLEEGKCSSNCLVKLARAFCHIVSVCYNQFCCSLGNGTTMRDGSTPSSCMVWEWPMAINFDTKLWYGVITLAGECGECNHSNMPCDCQR
jgi:hypothetical protein